MAVPRASNTSYWDHRWIRTPFAHTDSSPEGATILFLFQIRLVESVKSSPLEIRELSITPLEMYGNIKF